MASRLVNLRHTCDSPEATMDLGYRLARELLSMNHFPTIVLLCGVLGAGKTVFSGGIAQGLGIDEPIQSPTFPIFLEYLGQAKVPLYHFDLYRLFDSEEFDLIGGEEILFSGGSYGAGLSLLEWPERLGPIRPCFQVDVRMDMALHHREIDIHQLSGERK